ncbi:MAG TPA: hypothetical protein VGE67_11680 [Haloferula sp.]
MSEVWQRMTTTHAIAPRWLTFKGASLYSGLSVRLLQDHVKAGRIIASNVTAPGATRGRRLLSRESLDELIEEGIGKVSTLSMNSGRKGGDR